MFRKKPSGIDAGQLASLHEALHKSLKTFREQRVITGENEINSFLLKGWRIKELHTSATATQYPTLFVTAVLERTAEPKEDH